MPAATRLNWNLERLIRRAVVLGLMPTAACGSGVTAGAVRVDAGEVMTRNAADSGSPLASRDGGTRIGSAGAGSAAAGRAGSAAGSGGAEAQAEDAGLEDASVVADAGCAASWLSGDASAGGVVLWPCGAPPRVEDGPTTFDVCADLCLGSHKFNFCFPDGVDAGTPATRIRCTIDHTGRRPASLVESATASSASVGDVLARAAYLEQASVAAFLELAGELTHHALPHSLLARLHEAAADEVRHARDVGAFARRLGATPSPVVLAVPVQRELLAIALDNAREGCVRETYGVASAFAQAKRASDPQLRATMLSIAHDEARHAALSWDLAAWLDTRLDARARAQVAQERNHAVATLTTELQAPVPEPLRATLGIPSAPEAQNIIETLRRELWDA